jgi:hypothetical protein
MPCPPNEPSLRACLDAFHQLPLHDEMDRLENASVERGAEQRKARMAGMRTMWLVGLMVSVWGCSSQATSSLQKTGDSVVPDDASQTADGPVETRDDGAVSCFPLFHGCAATTECCSPNRCLNITGTFACQQEGPAPGAD